MLILVLKTLYILDFLTIDYPIFIVTIIMTGFEFLAYFCFVAIETVTQKTTLLATNGIFFLTVHACDLYDREDE